MCPAESASKISSFVTLFAGRGLKIAVFAVMSWAIPVASTFGQSAVPLEAYGVWDRNAGEFDPGDPDYDYLLAIS